MIFRLAFSFVFIFYMHMAFSQTVLYAEGFETDGEGVRYTTNFYNLASPTCDFFDREPASPLNVCYGGTLFTGFRGNFFWGSEDIMSSPGNKPPGSIISNSFNISSYGSLQLSLYAATANDNTTRWETADSINIKVSFNGGPFITVGRFMGGGIAGGPLYVDDNLNGIHDAAELTIVSIPAFTKYTFNIPGSGNTMRVQLDFDQIGGSEELGIDDIEVKGTLVLPVLLQYFNAAVTNNGNVLSWMVDNAADISYFETEQSDNGRDFTTLASVTAGANAVYSFTDTRINRPLTYYRFKAVQQNGRAWYSAVIKINRNETVAAAITLATNPAVDNACIVITSEKKMQGTISIYNSNGTRLLSKTVAVGRGQTAITMDTKALPAGLYSLQFKETAGMFFSAIKMLKL